MTVNAEFQVNTFAQASQNNPTLTTLNDGRFVITWMSNGQGSGGNYSGIYAQMYAADGQAIGDEFQINSENNGAQVYPAITALSDGGFVVAWVSDSDTQDGSDSGIYGQMFKADGSTRGGEFQINSFTGNKQYEPALTGLKGGGFVASWTSYQEDGDGDGVFGQMYGADGTALGDEFRIATYTSDNQRTPDIAALENGGFVAVWASEAQVGDVFGGHGTYSIFGQRFQADGTAQGAEFQINTYIRDQQQAPAVTGLQNGDFVVSWQSNNQDGEGYGVFGQLFHANGAPVGQEFRLNTETASDQQDVDITALKGGGFVATWTSLNQDAGPADPSGFFGFSGIFGQKFHADGSLDGGEFQVNEFTKLDQQHASVSSLNDGGFVVSWQSNDNDRDWDGYGVYGRMFAGSSDKILTGTINADTLTGGTGNDQLRGLGGNDKLIGAQGNDTLLGGFGHDRLFGGLGSDTLKGDKGFDKLLGNGGSDRLEGGLGKDVLWGGFGNDTLFGNGWADTLQGGKGRDVLWGGKGHDVLNGGLGNDKLTGGVGQDVFVFRNKGGQDRIMDFQDDIDTIRLDHHLWDTQLTKQQVIDQFAQVVDLDIVFDFGPETLTLKGFSDLTALNDDLQIV